jgi:hypothetical protein
MQQNLNVIVGNQVQVLWRPKVGQEMQGAVRMGPSSEPSSASRRSQDLQRAERVRLTHSIFSRPQRAVRHQHQNASTAATAKTRSIRSRAKESPGRAGALGHRLRNV